MKRHAKASPAGSTSGRGLNLGSLRLVLLAISAAAFLLLPASQALAGTATVNLAGEGSGEVSSAGGEVFGLPAVGTPPIHCSGPPPSGVCQNTPEDYEGFYTLLALTATPAPGSEFTGWNVEEGTPLEGCAGKETSCGLAAFEPGASFKLTASFQPAILPIVTTGGTGAGANQYLTTLEGTVNPHGVAVAECLFEFGATAKYGASAPCVPSAAELGEGTEAEEVSGEVELEALKPSTTYHYRLTAANAGGASDGEDRTFTTGPPPSEAELPASDQECPNKAIRDTQVFGAILLPDCMALEMVSPPQKGGQPAIEPAISSDDERVRFRSVAALGGTAGGIGAGGDPYIASRGSSGWTTAATSPPVEIADGWEPGAAAQSFTPDFSRWFQIGSTQSQLQIGAARVFQGGLGGLFSPLSPLFAPLVPESRGDVTHIELRGASADHSRLYFVPGATRLAYLPSDPEPKGVAAAPNTYVAHLDSGGQPALELLARDRVGKVWGGNCGAQLGGFRSKSEFSEQRAERNKGAISGEGSRVYFSARPAQPQGDSCDGVAAKLRILERLESNQGPWIGELFSSECNRADCSDVDGNDYYQGASTDGAKVYFTTSRQLASSDHDADPSPATGTGDISGPTITEVTTTSGAFHVGQTIAASGIRPGKTITGVSGSSPNQILTLSGSAGIPSSGVALSATSECKGALNTSESCDLYLYDSTLPAGQRLVQVSAGEADAPTPGEGADVLNGATAISGDGSHVYFVAQGVLTSDESPKGTLPVEGEPNLYAWDRSTDATTFIGVLDPGDAGDLWGGSGILPVPVLGGEAGGDGHILPFVSNAPLSTDDSDGTHSDAFLYDADSEELTRASKAAPGGSDNGPFDLSSEGGGPTNPASLGTDFAEKGRGVSEDGGAATFTTAEALVPGDINGTLDRYLWRAGQVYRLPGVEDSKTTEVALSPHGATAAFPTPTPLLAQDGDSSADIYAVRAGGGFPEPPQPPTPCQPDQGQPGSPCQADQQQPPSPNVGAPPPGAGNVPPKPASCPHGKRKVRRKGKVRCVAKHSRKAHRTRNANANRRAGK